MKVLIFIALKIVEVLGLIFVPYWVRLFCDRWLAPTDGPLDYWGEGALILIITAIAILIVMGNLYVIHSLVKTN